MQYAWERRFIQKFVGKSERMRPLGRIILKWILKIGCEHVN
jgi:hypothetical protein